MARYARILHRFLLNSLIREMSFRGHFFAEIVGHVAWLGMLLIFVEVIYRNTADIKGWSQYQYIFLLGTHMMITRLFETLFFSNCWRVSELVRTGNLDFVLVRPANTQFLLSLERIDYSALANVPVALILCAYGAAGQGVSITVVKVLLFLLLVAAGVLILYSLLFMFAVTSVWMIRQTGVDHLWFYAMSLARYPAEIYKSFVGGALFFVLVFILPILMVSNLPANVVVRTFSPWMVAYIVGISFVLLGVSSAVFNLALKSYRSASS
ncbi:MAG: ABC transporter permease [Planctomycetota bacterium]|jgi:ABC-2 type transport system permease protein